MIKERVYEHFTTACTKSIFQCYCGFQKSSEMSDSRVDVQPLWEYPGVCLSRSKELLTFNLKSSLPHEDLEVQGSLPITM